MSNITINSLPTANTIDGSADILPIYTSNLTATQGINRNTLLGLSSAPVGLTDSQTLTNKILTSPTINGATLSGTLSGTYTIGGTPTFPSSVTTLTGIQTLTNKTLTSPTISAPTITNATLSADTVSGFSSSSTGSIYGMSVTSGVLASAAMLNSVNTAALQTNAVTAPKLALGVPVQVVNVTYSAVSTGTTTIPSDDTIPQNTEGDQYMSLAITPKATTNILVIDCTLFLANSANVHIISALFQDSTANALAVSDEYMLTPGGPVTARIIYTMAAGTTSSTTFKVRSGGSGAGTTTFNGVGGGRLYGATVKSSMVITEYGA
jgi:hypothetical protein